MNLCYSVGMHKHLFIGSQDESHVDWCRVAEMNILPEKVTPLLNLQSKSFFFILFYFSFTWNNDHKDKNCSCFSWYNHKETFWTSSCKWLCFKINLTYFNTSMNQWLKVKETLNKQYPWFTSFIDAIHALKERKGSSRTAIKRYITANYKVTPGAHFDSQVSAAIKRGLSKDVFSLPKGNSYRKKRERTHRI